MNHFVSRLGTAKPGEALQSPPVPGWVRQGFMNHRSRRCWPLLGAAMHSVARRGAAFPGAATRGKALLGNAWQCEVRLGEA